MTTAAVARDILLIENNEEEAKFLRAIILQAKPDCDIHWVKSSEEALSFIFEPGTSAVNAKAKLLHIIILDLNLPDGNGIEVISTIKKHPVANAIIVVTVSGIDEKQLFLKAMEAGANQCLIRSENFAQFAADLKRELGYYWL